MFIFCRCVGLDFMCWKLVLPPPRWHLFQHKGLQWWTKPLWWKNTFSLWLLLQMSIHVRYFFSVERYNSSVVCFRNIAVLFRQLVNAYWIHFEFCWSFDFWRSKVMSNTRMSRSERAVCVWSCVLVGCENCVPYNWAVIAKLIRSDCFFDQ